MKHGGHGRVRVMLLLACVAAVVVGCSRNARLAGKQLRDPKMRAVTHYGVTLDEHASPRQVVFALLRAIRDDVLAETPQARQAALDIEFDLCAAPAIAHDLRGTGLNRPELLYLTVSRWAPTLAQYVDNFEFDLPAAEARMTAPAQVEDRRVCDVELPLADPDDPRAGVYLRVRLRRVTEDSDSPDAPGPAFWRVRSIYFVPGKRPPTPSAKSVDNAPDSAAESAAPAKTGGAAPRSSG